MKKGISWMIYMVAFVGAIITGLLGYFNVMPEFVWLPWLFVLLGLVIGAMNITNAEAVPVMVAALVLGASVGILALLPAVGGLLENIFLKIAALSIPIALPVGLKTLWMKAS